MIRCVLAILALALAGFAIACTQTLREVIIVATPTAGPTLTATTARTATLMPAVAATSTPETAAPPAAPEQRTNSQSNSASPSAALTPFGAVITGREIAGTLEAQPTTSAMIGASDPYARQELDATYANLRSCVGTGTQAGQAPGASSECSAVRQRASAEHGSLDLSLRIGLHSPALRAALSELDGFISQAC